MSRLLSLAEVEAKSAVNRAAHQPRRVNLLDVVKLAPVIKPPRIMAPSPMPEPVAVVSFDVNLILPWPPTINHYYRRRRDGGLFIGVDGKNYRRSVGSYCMAWKVKPLLSRVGLSIICNPPDKRKRDIDNLLKCLLDSLMHGGCFKDDSQIDDIHIARSSVIERGRVTVQIRELS